MSASAQLTICSVSYGEGEMLGLNHRVTKRLNPSGMPRWLAIRNQPVQAADDALASDPRFDVVAGAEFDATVVGAAPRSFHHALGMNLAAANVQTRFAMFLDPDCFLLRANWVEEILAHMLARDLATFGLPYHPRTSQKIRYVPCGVGIVVDTERLPIDDVDWTPGACSGDRMPLRDRLVIAALQRAKAAHRLRIEASADTGIMFYRRHRAQGVSAECVQPVMQPIHLRSRLRHPRERVLELILPDRFCLIPKRPGYFTDRGFASFGCLDLANEGCEEYMWRGTPFALHLRGGPPSLREDLQELERVLEELIS